MASEIQHLSITSLELSNALAGVRNACLMCPVGFSAPGGAGVVLWGGHKAPWAAHSRALLVQGQGQGPGFPCACGILSGPDQHWCLCCPGPLSHCPKRPMHTGAQHLPLGAFIQDGSQTFLSGQWDSSISPVTWAGVAAVPALPGLWNTRIVHWAQWDVRGECTEYQDFLGICCEPFGQTLPCRKS